MPINLSIGTKEPSGSAASPLKSGVSHRSRKTTTLRSLHSGKDFSKHPCSPLELVRRSESDIRSSKDSEDSLEDDLDDDIDDDEEEDDDDIEDEDTGTSLSG